MSFLWHDEACTCHLVSISQICRGCEVQLRVPEQLKKVGMHVEGQTATPIQTC